jgi:hypothetical protein
VPEFTALENVCIQDGWLEEEKWGEGKTEG